MAVGESPAVARHRLRRTLRHARGAKGLTQGEVASALEWSLSKVNRIEAGEVSISGTDLQALMQLLGITETDQVQELMAQARAARRKDWWDRPEYRDHLTPAVIQALQFEAHADVVRSFQPVAIPGVLQTHAYAAAVLDLWKDDLSEADRASRLEVRLWRGNQLFNRSEPPGYLLVLDESVLHREVGGPQAMSEQLYHLLELCRAGQLVVRVTPFVGAIAYAMFGMFTIYANNDEDELLYREGHTSDEVVYNPDRIRRHRQMFEQIWAHALSVEASAHLLEARAAALVSTIDRMAPES